MMANKKGAGRPVHEGLTDAQVEAIIMMVYSKSTNKQVAEKAGVSERMIYKWLKDARFMEALHKERVAKFNELGNDAIRVLQKLMMDESDKRTQLQACKLVLMENNFATGEVKVESEDDNKTITVSIK